MKDRKKHKKCHRHNHYKKLPSNIILMRHGEKYGYHHHLNIDGIKRSELLINWLSNLKFENGKSIEYIYAIKPNVGKSSSKSSQTIQKFSTIFKIPINMNFEVYDLDGLINDIMSNKYISGKNILICWSHTCMQTILKKLYHKVKLCKNITKDNYICFNLDNSFFWDPNDYSTTLILRYYNTNNTYIKRLSQNLLSKDPINSKLSISFNSLINPELIQNPTTINEVYNDQLAYVNVDWNQDIRTLIIAGIYGALPIGGSAFATLIGIFWPSTDDNANLWLQILNSDIYIIAKSDLNNLKAVCQNYVAAKNKFIALTNPTPEDINAISEIIATTNILFISNYNTFLGLYNIIVTNNANLNPPNYDNSNVINLLIQFINLNLGFLNDVLILITKYNLSSLVIPIPISETITNYITSIEKITTDSINKFNTNLPTFNTFNVSNQYYRAITLNVYNYLYLWPGFDPNKDYTGVDLYLGKPIEIYFTVSEQINSNYTLQESEFNPNFGSISQNLGDKILRGIRLNCYDSNDTNIGNGILSIQMNYNIEPICDFTSGLTLPVGVTDIQPNYFYNICSGDRTYTEIDALYNYNFNASTINILDAAILGIRFKFSDDSYFPNNNKKSGKNWFPTYQTSNITTGATIIPPVSTSSDNQNFNSNLIATNNILQNVGVTETTNNYSNLSTDIYTNKTRYIGYYLSSFYADTSRNALFNSPFTYDLLMGFRTSTLDSQLNNLPDDVLKAIYVTNPDPTISIDDPLFEEYNDISGIEIENWPKQRQQYLNYLASMSS